jgi:hypothetical protein
MYKPDPTANGAVAVSEYPTAPTFNVVCSRQFGEGFRAGSLHRGGAVIFHRALADVKVGGDVLVRITGEQGVHDLAFPGRQGSDVPGGVCAPCDAFAGIAGVLEGSLEAFEQRVGTDRLFDEVEGSRLHRRVKC